MATIDSQQSSGDQLPVSLPSGSASKGPRLPLRPKTQQLQSRTASVDHTQQTPRLPSSAQNPAMTAKQLQASSCTPTGQENSFQSWHMPTASHNHSLSHAADASLPHTAVASSSNSWTAQHLSSSAQQDLPTTSTAHASIGRDYNVLASPGQLASNLQQAVLGQTQAASEISTDQGFLTSSQSYANNSPGHLGNASIPMTVSLK